MKKQKPNIIFICADQWRGDCLGIYKNQHPVVTPHLNQLSREGYNFTRAYADCPLCMPQRMSMLTGKTGTTLNCLNNFHNEPASENIRNSITLPQLFGEQGYHTQAIGKMHFSPVRARYGFDNVVLHPNDYINFLEDNGYGGAYRGHGVGGNEVYPCCFPAPEKYYHTSWIIEESIRFLDRRDPESPFFLSVIFEAPHSPFDPPEPYDKFYDNYTIAPPLSADWNFAEDYPMEFRKTQVAKNLCDLTPEIISESRRRYYGQITHIDYQLGRLLGALQTRGLDYNTAIVFTSDHGEMLGDHQLFGKYCFLEGSARIPLIIRLPKSSDLECQVSPEQVVMTADIAPTLLELTGVEQVSGMDGKSLLQSQSETRIIFGETESSICAISDEFKYIYYINGGVEQLFSPQNDQNDLNNLINDSNYSSVIEHLRTVVIDYFTKKGSKKIENGKLICLGKNFDQTRISKLNTAACRGPMRWGSGY